MVQIERAVFIVLLILSQHFNHLSLAQSGDFILTHHSPKHSEIDNVNFHITADQDGVLCIANRFGVLKYDGVDWEFFKTNSSALSLAVTDDNTIYVGGIGEFGKMDILDNEYQYIPLLKNDSLTDHFIQSFDINQTIYFVSDKSVYGYDSEKEEVKLLSRGDFLNAYEFDNKLYVNTIDDIVFVIDRFDVIEDVSVESLWGLIQPSPNGQHTIGVDLNGDLFTINGRQKKPIPQNEKIKEAELSITQIAWVNDSLVAYSTIESGVFFLNINNDEYFEVTDYHSGLPDNEIHDLYADSNGGVWVAHEFGLTRISPLFPAYSYTNFPGLEGNLIEAQRLHGDLWVNTSLGVFYFKQDTSFQSKVSRQAVKTKNKSAQEAQKEVPPEDKKKKGFLKGIFRKKNRSEGTVRSNEEKGFFKQVFQAKKGDDVIYVRRVEKIVTGISYQFHHVNETDGKFIQLLETADRILATSHKGIYEIKKSGAELVIDVPTKFAYTIPSQNRILVSTEDGFLKSYELINEVWVETSQQYFNDIILNAYMDSEENIWLAGTTHIYRGFFKNGLFYLDEEYEINNRFYDELSIWGNNGELYFINSQGYYRFDKGANRIIRDNSLANQIGIPHHHIHNEKNRVWIYNGKIWSLLLPNGEITEFSYLGVYPDLKYISFDEELGRYWLITGDNQLLAYSANKAPKLHSANKLFIRAISSKNGDIKISNKLKLTHEENYLNIELLKLDYLGILNPEYQYKLEGLNQDWSNWTHANLIDYSYLPPGEYKLLVRTRDVFGENEEEKLLSFSVGTPYWQMPWFYAIQVFILILIVSITSKLNENKPSNRIIKSGLSILTLVVIVEFLQSIISAYLSIESTPVVDFLIDAGIAVMIFPLEWMLRKLWLEGGYRFMKQRLVPSSKKEIS